MSECEQLKMQEIIDIQRSILSRLSVGFAYQDKERNIYIENLLNLIIKKKTFWFWQLLFVPLDNDFLELSYRIVLGREPDMEGFSHFHAALSANAISRLKVLVTMKAANEKKYPLVSGGWRWIVGLNKVNAILRRIPMVGQFPFLYWRLSTSFARAQREESLTKEILDNQRELVQFEIDLNEFLNNPLRRNFFIEIDAST